MKEDKTKYEPILQMIFGAVQGLTIEDVSQLLGYTLNEAFISFYKQAKNKGTAKAYIAEYFKKQNNIFLEDVKKLEKDECKIILN
jgi:hypothetical protein